MKINNQIKEIEKEIKYYEDFSKKKDIHAFPTYLQKLIELKIELELLKQFQKEIKEVQGELNRNVPDNWLHPVMEKYLKKKVYTTEDIENILSEIREEQNKIFKNKFGEIR